MDAATTKTVCKLMAGLVVADDHLDSAEEAYLDRFFERVGFDVAQKASLFPVVHAKEAVTMFESLPQEHQLETLEHLVGAACADGRVVPREREILDAVAAALGMSEADLEERLATELAQ